MLFIYIAVIILGIVIRIIGPKAIFNKLKKRIFKRDYLLVAKRKLSVQTEEEIVNWWTSRLIRIISMTSVIFIALGIIGVAVVMNNNQSQSAEIELSRAPYGGDESVYNLDAEYPGGTKEEIDVSISPKEYTKEEVDMFIKDAFEKGFKTALKDNEDYDKIDSSLNLVKSLDDNPCRLSWEIEPDSLFDLNGELLSEVHETCTGVIRLTVSMGERKELESRNMVIYPKVLTKSELIKKELMDSISAFDKKDVSEDTVKLPKDINGVHLNDKKNDNTAFILALIILLPVLLYLKERQDIKTEEKLRKESLICDYPELVNKVVLYLGSGNTIKGSFIRMCEGADLSGPLYMELNAMINELGAGVSENVCYEKVSKRLNEQCYVRFFNLLVQNLSKGNVTLLKMLKAERQDALKVQRDYAKKKGEEASTKLLLPMMMLLIVSMIVVMVPALYSMAG